MATLSGNKIKDTYQSLVKFSDNGNITTSAKQLTDGFGNNSPMWVSTTQVGIGVTPESGLNLHVYGDAKIGSNLTVIGNLVVEGSTTTVGTDTLTVKDPLIVLANNNTSTDAVDIGFYGKYTPSGTTLYSGLFREALTGKYRLFKDLQVEPTTTVNTSGTGYAVATLIANLEGSIIGGTISGTTGTFSGNVDIDGTLDVDDVISVEGSGFGRIEVGGASGGYIDLKAPNSDDYDFRLITSTGGAELYSIDTLKFYTGATTDLAITIDASQDVTLEENLILKDAKEIIWGNDFDLKMYHNNTKGVIRNTTGSLDIQSVEFLVEDTSGSNWIKTAVSGAVQLYYGGSLKLSTSSTGIQVTGDLTATNGVHLADSVKASFGNSDDLEIYHNGSHSYISNDTGNFEITSTGSLILQDANSLKWMMTNQGGSVLLYYNGASKLTTTNTGVSVTGRISNLTDPSAAQDAATKAYVDSQVGANNELSEVLANGNTTGGTDIAVSSGDDITFADSSKSIYGAGSDLQIYSDGTVGYIKGNDARLVNASGENIFRVNGDVAELYYNDSKKLETTSSGVTVTGIITSDGLDLGDNDKIRLGNSQDLEIYHDGSHSYIKDTGTGDLKLQASNDIFLLDGSGNVMIEASEGGSVDLFYSGSKKLETTSTGVSVTGNIDGVGNLFLQDYIYHSGDGDTYFGFPTANEFKLVAGGSNIIAADANSAYLYYQGSSKLQTTSSGIDVTGNVSASGGISGTTGYFTDTLYVAEYIQHIGNTGNNIRFTTDAIAISADATFAGTVTAATYYKSSGTSAVLGTNASGEVLLRPTAWNLSTAQSSFTTTLATIGTDTTIAGNVTIGDNSASEIFLAFNSSSTDFALGANGSNFMIGTSSDLDTGNLITLSGANGRLGIGTTSPEDKLDIVGYLRISDNKTANTNKTNRIRGEHYDITEEPSTFMFMNSFSADTTLHIGGGSSIENAATLLRFFTAANNTTVAGTERMRIDSSGNLGIGTDSPAQKVHLLNGGFAYMRFTSQSYGATGFDIGQHTNGTIYLNNRDNTDMVFMTNNAERMRIDSSGNATFGGKVSLPDNQYLTWTSSNTRMIGNSDYLIFQVAASDKMAILSSGNVGIGTTSPDARFSVVTATANSTASRIGGLEYSGTQRGLTIKTFQSAGGDDCGVEFNAAEGLSGYGSFIFKADTAERMVIDSSGNVGIDVSAPDSYNSSARKLVVGGSGDSGITISTSSTNTGTLMFADGTGGTAGYRGRVSYHHNGDYMRFDTAATARMYIDSLGNVAIGGTTTQSRLEVRDSKTGSFQSPHLTIYGSGYGSFQWLDTDAYHIYTNSDGRDIEVICYANGVRLEPSATAWVSNSDISLKENIKPLENVLDKIKDYRCVEYNFKDDKVTDKKIGFIAQDWENDFSAVVSKDKNEKLGIKYTETIPVLLKAIQELKAEIEQLKTQINN
jgi:hypothetical protein